MTNKRQSSTPNNSNKKQKVGIGATRILGFEQKQLDFGYHSLTISLLNDKQTNKNQIIALFAQDFVGSIDDLLIHINKVVPASKSDILELVSCVNYGIQDATKQFTLLVWELHNLDLLGDKDIIQSVQSARLHRQEYKQQIDAILATTSPTSKSKFMKKDSKSTLKLLSSDLFCVFNLVLLINQTVRKRDFL